MAGRGCTPLILPPRSVPSHKLQKPSKEYGIFQLLGTINVVLVYIKGKVKRGGGGAWPNAPLNTLPVLVELRTLMGILHKRAFR